MLRQPGICRLLQDNRATFGDVRGLDRAAASGDAESRPLANRVIGGFGLEPVEHGFARRAALERKNRKLFFRGCDDRGNEF